MDQLLESEHNHLITLPAAGSEKRATFPNGPSNTLWRWFARGTIRTSLADRQDRASYGPEPPRSEGIYVTKVTALALRAILRY